MHKLFLLFSLVATITIHAQSKPSYTAGIEAGILKGGSDKSNAILFTNGIRYKNVMVGLGGGIDNYLFRSVPLFLSVRKGFGSRAVQPFVGASAGINFSHPTNDQKQFYSAYDSAHFKNGFIADASAGIAIKIYKQLHIFISAGYSYKTEKVIYKNDYFMINIPRDNRTDIYRMNRWYFSTGLWF